MGRRSEAGRHGVHKIIYIPAGYNLDEGILNDTHLPSNVLLLKMEQYGLLKCKALDEPLWFKKAWNMSKCHTWLKQALPNVFQFAEQEGLDWSILRRDSQKLELIDLKLNGEELFKLKGRTRTRVEDSKIYIESVYKEWKTSPRNALDGSLDNDTDSPTSSSASKGEPDDSEWSGVGAEKGMDLSKSESSNDSIDEEQPRPRTCQTQTLQAVSAPTIFNSKHPQTAHGWHSSFASHHVLQQKAPANTSWEVL
ncbi:hypothetical protein P691DRAFT_768058 [Macrolepiota fuliginosa MF-IS2]|uniref:Uncharacterized protein n=1 Tax=Macrolepiota fuliginosa MF-IS2 TaxID=1400762 RepID=A0A9P6BW65_9AGAR|nr:hypothetical protein P691DRAFT_768058 [Macrolepiota fuliginosa MF-IS2]